MFQKKVIAGLRPFALSEFKVAVEKIGQGSFGAVFLVESKHEPGVFGALKVFFESKLHERGVLEAQNFEREQRSLERVKNSEHIVTLWDSGQLSPDFFDVLKSSNSDGKNFRHGRFLLLSYCGGGDLFERILASENGLEPQVVISYAKQMLSALAFLAQKQIIHGDLKPENIFLTKDNVLKLGDFGFSYVMGEKIPQGGRIQSRYYMAPEVIRGQVPYTSAIDMWSAGCILYTCLTKELLFRVANDSDHLILIKSLTEGRRKDFLASEIIFKGFIENMLVEDVSRRITAESALGDPLMTSPVPKPIVRMVPKELLKKFDGKQTAL